MLLDMVQLYFSNKRKRSKSGAMGNSKGHALTISIVYDSNVLQNLKLELRITMPTDGNKAN